MARRKVIRLFEYSRMSFLDRGGHHEKTLRAFIQAIFKEPIITDRSNPDRIRGALVVIEEEQHRYHGMVCVSTNHPRPSVHYFPLHMWGYLMYELERGEIPQDPIPVLDPDSPDMAAIVPSRGGNFYTFEGRTKRGGRGSVTLPTAAVREIARRVCTGLAEIAPM